MDSGAVKAIADLARPSTVMVDARNYSTVPLYPVTEPAAATLEFGGLQGFVDYILRGPDKIAVASAVHVVGPTSVRLAGELYGDFRQREFLAAAAPRPCPFPFGTYLDQERFIVALQSLFVPSDVRDEVLRLAGVIMADEIRTQSDNGISQEVTAKAGTRLIGRVDLPNPVVLRPYRTFREVEQPESAFILRARKGAAGAELALFEADGGAWELVAMAGVAEYLRKKLPNVVVLA